MKPWKLYLFPGGLVGECRYRWQAILWVYCQFLTLKEKRAINETTGEHIVS